MKFNSKKILFPALAAMTLALSGCGGTPGTSSAASTDCNIDSEDGPGIVSPLADGIFDYSTATYEEKLTMLSSLEKYALKNHLAGIPLYDDSSYQQFSARITLPTTTYITNYGFGVGEGTLVADGQMYDGAIVESTPEWKSYFHDYTTVDSGTFNYWDSTGSDVAGRNSMISASYYDVEMNENKTDYKWVAGLAKADEPIMLDASGNVITDTEGKNSKYWRVPLKTGADGITYSVPETSPWYEKYNGLNVELEDYLTPYKAMLDNRFSRASSLGDDSSGFEGVMRYMYSSAANWNDVGIQINEAEGSLDFTFITAKTMNYARTCLSSSLYSPLPSEFLTDIGGAKNFGVYTTNADATKTLDNIISVGAYVPEYWQKDSRLVYKKNPNFYGADQYHYDGVTEDVYTGSNAEVNAYKDFLANKLDEVTIPVSYMADHKSDPNTYHTKGSTIIKLNLNTCTDSEWEYYFGENGTISSYRHKRSNYWDVQPIMSNDDFINGMFFSINREELAAFAGRNPALGYLSNAYTQDPDAKEFYRDTDEGKAALKDYTDVDPNGHSDSLAKQLFARAVETLICEKKISAGTQIDLQCYYRYQDTIDNLGKYVKKYVEDNFNAACKQWNVTLNLNLQVGGTSYTDTYTRMDSGEYDIAEGAISGNVLNPLDFMNTCCTDSLAQGFCLNWGDVTAKVNESDPIVYNNMSWSYDALYKAANGSSVISKGIARSINENPRIEASSDYVSLVSDYPDITDDEGMPLIEFEGSDGGIFFSDSGSFTSGWYTSGEKFVFENGVCAMRVPMSEVKSRAKSYAKSAAPNYIYLQYELSYSFMGGATQYASVYATAKMSDLGLGDITASVIPATTSRGTLFCLA